MGGGFQFIDIILFALVAAFFIFRLRNALGRRDGHEQRPFDPASRNGGAPGAGEPEPDGDNVIALPGHEQAEPAPDSGEAEAPASKDDPLSQGLAAVRAADASFEPDEFLAGARVAFDMVLTAFAAGDRAALKNLLGAEAFADFDAAVSERERARQTVEDTLVGIISAEIVEAALSGRDTVITVKFVSEQISVTYDENGETVDGDPKKVTKAADYWTFARSTRARDPNWSLIGTASAE
ncbi:MAG: Tim44/TimA family putative adaptor protein [Rhodospirillales bacterium]